MTSFKQSFNRLFNNICKRRRRRSVTTATASIKYIASKTESIQLRVPKGKKAKYQEFAISQDKSLNNLVQELLEDVIGKSKQN